MSLEELGLDVFRPRNLSLRPESHWSTKSIIIIIIIFVVDVIMIIIIT